MNGRLVTILWCLVGLLAGGVDAEAQLDRAQPAQPAGADNPIKIDSIGLDPISIDEIHLEPRVFQVELDPAGTRVAFLLREHQGEAPLGLSLWLMDLRTGEKRRLTTSRALSAVQWSADGEVLFLQTEKNLGRMFVDGGRPSWIFKFEEGRDQSWVGVDPVLPRHFLVLDEGLHSTDGEQDSHRLLRVDTQGNVETVFAGEQTISSWLTDALGNLTFIKETVRSESGAVNKTAEQVIYRLEDLAHGPVKTEIYRCPLVDACGLVAHDPSAGLVWIQTYHGGDRWRLVSLALESGEVKVEHEDPAGWADLGRVSIDPRSGRPYLASYETDRRREFGLQPSAELHAGRIRERFDGASLTIQARESGPFWLIEEQRARLHHPRFHAYEPVTGSFREILVDERNSVEMLPHERLVDSRPITYTARDGMQIHGYVWLPEHVDLSGAPVVANIHGGPWNRVRYGFHGMAQLLVSRGYVVFQPNFRGSSGYGRRYLVAAKGQLSAGAVQEDILDGLNYLSSRGWGDPKRRAITGHSYGGYAALGASVHQTSQYVAAVATAAPIDLVRSFRDMDPKLTQRNGVSFKEWARPLFVDLDDAHEVAEERAKAPEANVRQTALPLLMMAGGKDVKIDVTDVKHYASLLFDQGKDVTLLIDDEAGHSFETPHMRPASIYLIDQFLARHLGGEALDPKDPELEAYVAGRLLLRGESFSAESLVTKGRLLPQMGKKAE